MKLELKSDKKLNKALAVLRSSPASMVEAGSRMSGLIKSLKSFSNLDEADSQTIDLRESIETTLGIVETAVKGRCEVVLKFDQIPELECRPRELNQMFLTILLNAFEAMKGTGQLTISTATNDDGILIEIRDTGPGIESDLMDNLFDIGFSTKNERVGMRLGLPMSRTIVESHGGRLDVESVVGVGTTFKVTLPIGLESS